MQFKQRILFLGFKVISTSDCIYFLPPPSQFYCVSLSVNFILNVILAYFLPLFCTTQGYNNHGITPAASQCLHASLLRALTAAATATAIIIIS